MHVFAFKMIVNFILLLETHITVQNNARNTVLLENMII